MSVDRGMQLGGTLTPTLSLRERGFSTPITSFPH